MTSRACVAHGDEPSAAVCWSCDRGLCSTCWRRTVDGEPWCDPCVELLRRPVPWLVPVAGAALAIAVGAAVAVTHVADPLQRWGGVALGAVLVAVATWRLTRWAGLRRLGREVLDRPVDAVAVVRGHPYRGALRRAGRRVTPPLSGVMAAVVVGASLAIAATVAPLAMARPLWIEIEVVLAIWWVLLSVSLTVLLHRGARIARDL